MNENVSDILFHFQLFKSLAIMTSYRKFTLDAPGVKVLNHDITPGTNPKNGGGGVGYLDTVDKTICLYFDSGSNKIIKGSNPPLPPA